jgi:putative membrane protein
MAKPGLLSAALVLATLALLALLSDFGPQARHMGVHILLMNVLAPAAAALLLLAAPPVLAPVWLWAGAAAQLAMLWLWHAPAFSTLPHALHLALYGPLLASALLFWCAVAAAARWQAVLALLLTGKLTCLLAVLLVFAPRALYPHAALADQQFAGLLMLAACPLSYLGAALVITLRIVGVSGAAAPAPR